MKCVLIILFATLVSYNHSLIHQLNIVNYTKNSMMIETFRFQSGGEFNITISNFNARETMKKVLQFNGDEAGIIRKVDQNGTSLEVSDLSCAANSNEADSLTVANNMTYKGAFVLGNVHFESSKSCLFDHLQEGDIVIGLNNADRRKYFNFHIVFDAQQAGEYSLMFDQCVAGASYLVDFNLNVTFKNPGNNYLSHGAADPLVYVIIFIAYTCTLFGWLHVIYKAKEISSVTQLHYLMLITLGLKLCLLLVTGLKYYNLAVTGLNDSLLINSLYYTVDFVFRSMIFSSRLLVAIGWNIIQNDIHIKAQYMLIVGIVILLLQSIIKYFDEGPWCIVGRPCDNISPIFDLINSYLLLCWTVEPTFRMPSNDSIQTFSAVNIVGVLSYIVWSLIWLVLKDHLEFWWLNITIPEAIDLIYYIVIGYSIQRALDDPHFKRSSTVVDSVTTMG